MDTLLTGSSSQGSGHRSARQQVSPQQVSSHVDVKSAAKSKPSPKEGIQKKGQPAGKKDEKMDMKTLKTQETESQQSLPTKPAENVAAKSSTGKVFSQWLTHDGMFSLTCHYETGRSHTRLSFVWVFVRRQRRE